MQKWLRILNEKMRYKSLIFVLSFILWFSSLIFFTQPIYAVGDPWYTDQVWLYRKAYTITNAGSELTDYQVMLSLNTATLISDGKMLSNCDDIRVTDSNDTLLPYWIESGNPGCNNASTKIWTKLTSIPNGATTIYINYGNSEAINQENGDQVFAMFDDFSKNGLDTSKWTKVNGGSVTLSGGELTAGAGGDPSKLVAIGAPQSDYYVMRARFKSTGGGSGDERIGVGIKTSVSTARGYNYVLHNFSSKDHIGFLNDGVVWNDSASSWTGNTYYVGEIYHDGTNVKGRINDGSWDSWATSGNTGYPSLNIGSFDATSVWDFAAVRKYSSNDPSIGNAGNEESHTITHSWLYRRVITFDNSAQNENLTNIPILITFDSNSIDYNSVNSDGSDLLFTDSDGQTIIPYEIEKWNSSGTSYVWVKVPQIDASSSTDYIYVYYGNSANTLPLESESDVWDSNYKGVWHLNETTGTLSPDSSSYKNNGVKVSSTNPNPITTGPIDGADSFDGSGDYINIPNSTSLDITTSSITVSAWVKPDVTGSYKKIVVKGTQSSPPYYLSQGPSSFDTYFGIFSSGGNSDPNTTSPLSTSSWSSLVGVYDGSFVRLYINGVQVATEALTGTINSNSTDVRIGAYTNGMETFDGSIDEVRISNSARSAAYIAAQYKAESGTYVTVGDEELTGIELTWDGGGGDNNFSTCANWSGDVCPSLNDSIIFDSTSTKNATIDSSFAASVGSITINSGYSGTITLARSFTVGQTFAQNAGSFTSSSQSLTLKNLSLTSGSFTASSTTTTLKGNLIISGGTYNHNSGTLAISGTSTSTITCNNNALNAVTISKSGSGAGITVSSTCSIPLGSSPTISLNNGVVTLNGTISGSGTLTVSSGSLTINSNGSLSGFSGLSLSNDLTLDSKSFNFGSYSPMSVRNVTLQNASTVTAPTGTFNITGDLSISIDSTLDANNGTIAFTGSDQSIDCPTFHTVTFNISGIKTLTNACTLPLGNNPTIPENIVVTDSVTYSGTGTLTIEGDFTIDGNTTLSGFNGLTVGGLLSIEAPFDASSYSQITVPGAFAIVDTFTAPQVLTLSSDFTNGGTFNHNNGTVVFTSDSDNNIYGETTFYNLTKQNATNTYLYFEAGYTQTIAGALTLTGESIANKLYLRSTADGTEWFIDPQGARTATYLSVKDSNNSNVNAISATNSFDAGNNTNWVGLISPPQGYEATDVLGQTDSEGNPDFTTNIANNRPNSTGFNYPPSSAVDTTYHQLFVQDFNNRRVLVYNLDSSNELVDYTADFVLGQPNFRSIGYHCASEATDKTFCYSAFGMTIDNVNHRLFVSDTYNHRVLVFDTTNISTYMSASYVLGQPDFVTATAQTTQNRMSYPRGLTIDNATNYLYVLDSSSRVLIFDTTTITNGMNASYVLGEVDFTTSVIDTNQKGFYSPYGIAVDSTAQLLYVADTNNQRLLVFDILSISNNMDAAYVLGQANFTSNTADTNQKGFSQPIGVAIAESTGFMYVTDSNNHRVLVFDTNSLANNMDATYVLGQDDFVSNSQTGCYYYNAVNTHQLCSPQGVLFDSTNNYLYVSDTNNARILIFDNSSLSNNMDAFNVVGQTDTDLNPVFDTGLRNNQGYQGIPTNSGFGEYTNQNHESPSAENIMLDETHHRLFTVDRNNSRVLVFNLNTDDSPQDRVADYVFGQVDFNSSECNQGGDPSAQTLCEPWGLEYDATNNRLFIGDAYNQRILVYELSSGISNGMAASLVIGQADFTSSSCVDTCDYAHSGLYEPRGISFDPTTNLLYVANNYDYRVLVFDANPASLTNNPQAVHVLGQFDFESSDSTTDEFHLYYPLGVSVDPIRQLLYVADNWNYRVVVYDVSSIDDGEAAVHVLGQPTFTETTTYSGQNGLDGYINKAIIDTQRQLLYVTDRGNNRIMIFDVDEITDGEDAVAVLGQKNFDDTNSNQGRGSPTNYTLYEPFSVFPGKLNNSLYVADSYNHRVLFYEFVHLTDNGSLSAQTNSVYNKTLETEHSQGTLTFSITSGSLPSGISLNSSTGVLSGTPSTAGTYTFTVKVTDTPGDFGSFFDEKEFSLTVSAGSVVSSPKPEGEYSTTEAPTCTIEKPGSVPSLYNITRNAAGNSMQVYFTPVTVNTQSYLLSYGTTNSAEGYSVTIDQPADTSGAISYTIGSLTPTSTYYVMVKAQNACASSKFSSVKVSYGVGSTSDDNNSGSTDTSDSSSSSEAASSFNSKDKTYKGRPYLNFYPEYLNHDANQQGVALTSSVGDIYYFALAAGKTVLDIHTISIDTIDTKNKTVTITINSTPQTTTLKAKETKTFDVDGDTKADIQIAVDDVLAAHDRQQVLIRALALDTSKNTNTDASYGLGGDQDNQSYISNLLQNIKGMRYVIVVMLIMVIFGIGIYTYIRIHRSHSTTEIG